MNWIDTNLLLDMIETGALPDFHAIRPEHAEPLVDALIARGRASIAESITGAATPSWDTVIAPLDASEDRMGRGFAPIAHLTVVMDSPAWRRAFEACRIKLAAYSAELGQNVALLEAVKTLRASAAYATFDHAQQRVVDDILRDFQLSGVSLPAADQARYRQISTRLGELATCFQQHVQDALRSWTRHVTNVIEIDGLPESSRALLAQCARERGLDGWLITLDSASAGAVMAHATSRALRADVHYALATLASDIGPGGHQYDNGPLIEEIVALRHESARLLGFDDFLAQSLSIKMAREPARVERFLLDLAERARGQTEADLAALEALASEDGLDTLEAWDLGYYSERLRQRRYTLTSEDLRPYFALDDVLAGLFAVVEKLYGVRAVPRDDISTWHPDVRVFELRDSDPTDTPRAIFYLDPFARDNKQNGAWMAAFQSRRRVGDHVQLPVAFLVCSFAPPIGGATALLRHGEVITLFHEFGHGLHHMLTRVDYSPVAGIVGVEWDAVELPSQFMENWCWQRAALDLFARHHETGAPLPDALFAQLTAARQHMAAAGTLEQVELALFDLRVHRDFDTARGACVMDTLAAVRDEICVVRVPDYNRLPHAFTHVFAGGYGAGYYSYKWAEVLSADVFSAFEEAALFDSGVGQKFLVEILERGSTRSTMDNFIAFRGREPTLDAMLRHSGLVQALAGDAGMAVDALQATG